MACSRRDFLAALAVTPGAGRTRFLQQPRRRAPAVSPIETYGATQQALRAVADPIARPLPPGGDLRLEGHHGAYVPSLASSTARRGIRGQPIGADGLLVFAVDLAEPSYVSGELVLVPDANLRPGLRASVHCDDTLVAAPMVTAAEWSTLRATDAAPRLTGTRPGRGIVLPEWLLGAGRHHLMVAAPHTRPAGAFQALTVQARSRPVREAIYSFAFISDTHVGGPGARREARNRVLADACAPALRATLTSLAAEGISLAIVGGDLTEGGTAEQCQEVAAVFGASSCTVQACLGAADVADASAAPKAIELLAPFMAGGSGDYTFTKAPIRFIVMAPFGTDAAVQAQKQQWLVDTLAADRRTPTVLVWHAPPYQRGGVSSCGYRMPEESALGRRLVLDVLQRAPNVFATLNGDGHWDEIDYLSGITHIQNAAFAEWPNSYRVFRVYADRVEWEVRQVANRGFVRESLVPAKGLTWMIATRETDTTGQAMLRRPAPSV